MAQAVVDPAELRRFAHNLKQFNHELEDRLSVLHGQMTGLSQSWRDAEHEKFSAEFEQTLIVIHRFMDSVGDHIPFLLSKAQLIEEYMQQR